jgi:excisionase family DNA binding protein
MSPQAEAQTTRERGFLTGSRRIVDADAVCLKVLHYPVSDGITLSTQSQHPPKTRATGLSHVAASACETARPTAVVSTSERIPKGLSAAECDRVERVRREDPAMESLDGLLTVEDLAHYLDVPVATVYAWRYRRQGSPGFRVGRHLRFRRSDVERWIEDRIGHTSQLRGTIATDSCSPPTRVGAPWRG